MWIDDIKGFLKGKHKLNWSPSRGQLLKLRRKTRGGRKICRARGGSQF